MNRPSLHLADVPVPALRRTLLTLALFLAVLALFVSMVHELLVAAVLGAIIGAYLLPVQRWIAARTGREAPAAVLTLVLLIVPALALLVYGYLEVRSAAEYLAANAAAVAVQINDALSLLPLVGEVQKEAAIERALAEGAALALEVPAGAQAALSEFAVDTSVFLFTAFYVFIRSDVIVAYLRGKVPPRYGAFAERLEQHVQGVLYGAVYSTLVTQTLKSVLVLVLCLVFGVPLAVALALLTFLIGFFPVVGSWTVVIPAAGYLLIFQDSPWEALAMAGLGLGISTVLLSFIVRPKLAAAESKVLDFYWMFIALVAGVYTFGVPGIVIGPVVVGVLKAVFDTITTELEWAQVDDGEAPEAKVFVEEKVAQAAPPGDRGEENRTG